MTIAFFQPRALFPAKTERTSSTISKSSGRERQKYRAVAVFSHHRDVKVALDELDDRGFSHDSLTLITRQAQHCIDYSELVISSNFECHKTDLNPKAQKFFSRLFKKGKYLLLVNGSEYDVNAASEIMSRRRDRARIWRFD